MAFDGSLLGRIGVLTAIRLDIPATVLARADEVIV